MIVTNSNDFNNIDLSNIKLDMSVDERIALINNLISIYEQKTNSAIGKEKIIYNQIIKMLKYKLVKIQPKTLTKK